MAFDPPPATCPCGPRASHAVRCERCGLPPGVHKPAAPRAEEGPPCATCAHPRAWHEPDPDTGEGPLECSPPDCSVCPCLDFAALRVEPPSVLVAERPYWDLEAAACESPLPPAREPPGDACVLCAITCSSQYSMSMAGIHRLCWACALIEPEAARRIHAHVTAITMERDAARNDADLFSAQSIELRAQLKVTMTVLEAVAACGPHNGQAAIVIARAALAASGPGETQG